MVVPGFPFRFSALAERLRRTREHPSDRPRGGALVAPLLVLGAYAVALMQRPGETIADTKVHLYVAPQRFLQDVVSVWSDTGDLGHVWGGQYNGYLFPMGPWFATGDSLGLPVWIVHRLWLGTLMAVAALGVVALLGALVDRRRGSLHAVGAVLYVASPYVAVITDRTSISMLAYAALPWLLLAVHRGLRDPRGLRWPAVFALTLACTGGGVNAAVIGWTLTAPLLLLIFELVWGGVGRRAAMQWLVRLVPLTLVVNLWWLVPLAVHSRYGLDFLPFTEQPGTIWGTSSLTESLRGMGFWTSYIGVGFGGTLRPYATHGSVLLFDLKVVLAGLMVPALVLLGLRWTHRARYAPFFLLLTLFGLLVMGVGFPEGTPLRKASTFAYNNVTVLQVLRTTYKAGPLVTLGLAALGGMAFAEAWRRVPRRPLRAGFAVGIAVLVALAAWPLTRGTAPDQQLRIDVPERWRTLAATLDKRPDDERALVVPGQLFASYRWGQTIDPILPVLTDHPVATRNIVPYADRRSVELQWAVDDLVSQERLVRGQLPSLLDLLAVGDVIVATDGDRTRSGELGALETADALATQPDLRNGVTIGGTRTARPASGRLAAAREVPLLRDVRVPTAGIVRVLPRGPLTVTDGGARALTNLAAFGVLAPGRPYAAAADLTPTQVRRAAQDGGQVVIADGNRRQAFVSSRLRGGTGYVLPATRTVSQDGTLLDPFDDTTAGADAQTVQLLDGVRDISAPFSPQVTQFPEHRPFAAMDGDVRTSWLAERLLPIDRRVLTVTFTSPRAVDALRLYPANDSRGTVEAVRVNGRRFAVRPGWNTLPVRLGRVATLDVAIDTLRRPLRASGGGGGIRELEIPGIRVREALRPPVLAERALRGAALEATTLTYLLERITAASPFRRERFAGPPQAALLRDARDPERQLARVVRPPVARSYGVTAWTRTDPSASDATLDRLAGTRGALTATSSSRAEGLPRYRASGAFDGGSRAWIGQWIRGVPAWLGWRTDEPTRLRRLRILPPENARTRFPTRVTLTVDGRPGPVQTVEPRGLVTLAAPVRGRDFRLDVVAARWPAGTPASVRARRVVGVGELRAAGLDRLDVPRTGRVALPCGAAALTVRSWPSATGARDLTLRVEADLRAFDAGRPLQAEGCGRVPLPADDTEITGKDGALVVDRLRLEAGPPTGISVVDTATQRVVSPGASQGTDRTGASVRTTGEAWLVFGQSYSRGWKATCDGRDLGTPVPLQGYANAWPITAPGCRTLDFTYGPDGTVRPAILVSGLGGVAVLAFVLAGALRRRRRRDAEAPLVARTGLAPLWPPLAPAATAPMSVRRAAVWGVGAALVLGFVFALRAGVVLGPLVGLVLWRGLSQRLLLLVAGAILALVVPAVYVQRAITLDDPGGFDTAYATARIWAHWPAVGAITLIGIVAVRSLNMARGRHGAPAPTPAEPAAP